ncbi:MAG: hypothetical protein HC922_04090 [Leptolyngbyaceae cyanobacterium SM2_3_12]|nr:hypothetical protein [Leptolyngbyaceae cyanobacterium SM2_3_12]
MIEQLRLTVEAAVAQRSVVALRAGQPMVVQPTWGSFLLPADLPGVEALTQTSRSRVELCDRHWLEVTLAGIWVAPSSTSDEGILMAELGEALEGQIVWLWQRSQAQTVRNCAQGLPKPC